MLGTREEISNVRFKALIVVVLIGSAMIGWLSAQVADSNGILTNARALIEADEDIFDLDSDTISAEDLDPVAVLAALDDLAAHPDDPLKPAGIAGVTDEQIEALHQDDVAFILDDALAIARDAIAESPRYLFEVGRVALYHGEPNAAFDLLIEAAEAGSAAAAGYLGWLAEDDATAHAWLSQAVAGGFASAQQILDDMTALPSRTTAQASPQIPKRSVADITEGFQRADLLKAMVEKDYEYLRQYRTESISYMLKLNSVLTDPSAWFRTNSAFFEQDLDHELMLNLNYITATDPDYLQDIVEIGVGGLWGMFQSLASERQSQQNAGTWDPAAEIAAANRGSIQHTQQIALLTTAAEWDGKRLLALYAEDPEAFREIYRGMVSYVRGAL